MLTLYGLKNCGTCRKARAWLEQEGVPYRFHDFRADGLDHSLLERLEAEHGWEALLNRRGTTWRELPEPERADLNRDKALSLMLAHPAIIKRPVFDACGRTLIGFAPERYAKELRLLVMGAIPDPVPASSRSESA